MAVIYLTSPSCDDLLSILNVVDGNRVTMPYPNTLFGLGTAGNWYLSVNDPAVGEDANGKPVWPHPLPASVTQDQAGGIAVLGVWA